jgi:hypothetical protein
VKDRDGEAARQAGGMWGSSITCVEKMGEERVGTPLTSSDRRLEELWLELVCFVAVGERLVGNLCR